jgi:acetoin utilization protein AcuB
MQVREIMTPDVETIEADATAQRARDLMKARRIRHLVVRRNARVVGVISESDVGGPRGSAPTGRVQDSMNRDVVTASSTTTLRDCANLLRGRADGCLPVVDDDRLVGVVTISDVLDALGRGATHLNERSRPYLPRRQGPPKKTREQWPNLKRITRAPRRRAKSR